MALEGFRQPFRSTVDSSKVWTVGSRVWASSCESCCSCCLSCLVVLVILATACTLVLVLLLFFLVGLTFHTMSLSSLPQKVVMVVVVVGIPSEGVCDVLLLPLPWLLSSTAAATATAPATTAL